MWSQFLDIRSTSVWSPVLSSKVALNTFTGIWLLILGILAWWSSMGIISHRDYITQWFLNFVQPLYMKDSIISCCLKSSCGWWGVAVKCSIWITMWFNMAHLWAALMHRAITIKCLHVQEIHFFFSPIQSFCHGSIQTTRAQLTHHPTCPDYYLRVSNVHKHPDCWISREWPAIHLVSSYAEWPHHMPLCK